MYIVHLLDKYSKILQNAQYIQQQSAVCLWIRTLCFIIIWRCMD